MNFANELRKYLSDKWVLVIEPMPNYKQSIRQFLSNLKIKNFKIVSTASEAKREMLTKEIGLFICEWRLPEKNGLEFCRSLRETHLYRTAPFLLTSGENLKKDVILASEAGIHRYLLKPFSFEDFYTQIEWTIQICVNPDPVHQIIDDGYECQKERDWANAIRYFEKALALRQTSARAHCGLARVLVEKNLVDRAMQHLQQAISANPDYLDAYRIILDVHERKGSLNGVIQAASILHSMSPENPKYPLLIARAYADLDNLDASEKHFKLAVKLSPMLADGYRGLGQVYLKKEEFQKAQKNLEKALDLGIGDVSTLNGLGLALVRQGYIEEGIRRYEAALKIDSDDARVLFNLGLACEISEKQERAKTCYQRALLSQPNLDGARRGLHRIENNTPLTQEERQEAFLKKVG